MVGISVSAFGLCFTALFQRYSDRTIDYVGCIAGNTLLSTVIYLAVVIASDRNRNFVGYRRDIKVTVNYNHLDVAVIFRRYVEVILRKPHVIGSRVGAACFSIFAVL